MTVQTDSIISTIPRLLMDPHLMITFSYIAQDCDAPLPIALSYRDPHLHLLPHGCKLGSRRVRHCRRCRRGGRQQRLGGGGLRAPVLTLLSKQALDTLHDGSYDGSYILTCHRIRCGLMGQSGLKNRGFKGAMLYPR